MDPTVNLEEFAKLILEAVKAGNAPLIVTLALLAVVAFLRKYAPIPFLKTRAGGWLSLFLFSGLGAVSTALVAGTAFSMQLVVSALGVGFAAAGGYEALKDLLPFVLRLIGMLPDPVAQAEKAGNDAAAADPAQGVAKVVPIKDVLASGSFGHVTPEMKAEIEARLIAKGYVKQPDGSFKFEPKGEQ